MNKWYRTRWASQYAVVSELTRRNYPVALPLGNIPNLDLLCQSLDRKSFSVQVKSLSSKTYFPLQNSLIEKEMKDLYFVFTWVPSQYNQPIEYLILSHKQLLDIWKKEKEEGKRKEKQRGRPYKVWSESISYRALMNFKDKWKNLPA